MKYIFLHGLGQTEKSWDKTVSYLNKDRNSDILCINLFEIVKGKEITYHNIYKEFSKYCSDITEPFALCGLSLGGIIALQYGIENPNKLSSAVLIGIQYKMPKKLLKFQNLIFKFMPEKSFKDMGIGKNDFISLSNSMMDLDFTGNLSNLKCPTLILCGEKDSPNKKAAYELNNNIKNSQIKIIENAGHEVNIQNPKALSDILLDFWH